MARAEAGEDTRGPDASEFHVERTADGLAAGLARAQRDLGGLLTSTAASLLVLPWLALRFGRFAPRPKGGA